MLPILYIKLAEFNTRYGVISVWREKCRLGLPLVQGVTSVITKF